MAVDFRDTRDEKIRSIRDHAERNGMDRDQARRWGEERMAKAMPTVVRETEREGKSRPIEIRSK